MVEWISALHIEGVTRVELDIISDFLLDSSGWNGVRIIHSRMAFTGVLQDNCMMDMVWVVHWCITHDANECAFAF